MGLGKVLLGVAAGLGVVAAAPVLGGVGVLTGVGALVGGGVGALGGAIASHNENEYHNNDYSNYNNDSNENEEKEYFKGKLTEDEGLAIYSLSISIAYCDGIFSKEEQEIINKFIKEIYKSNCGEAFKSKIKEIYENPPTFENVVRDYITKVDDNKWNIFDEVIEEVIKADDEKSKEEEEYRNKWEEYKKEGFKKENSRWETSDRED